MGDGRGRSRRNFKFSVLVTNSCLPPKVGMKREWELVEGEKKGRSSKEAKRSVFSISYAYMLTHVHYMLTCSHALYAHP